MIEKETDFWIEAETADAVVCTINTVLKNNGCLVMGAGIALDFAEKFEWLSERWGSRTALAEAEGGKTYPFVDNMNLNAKVPWLVGIHTKLDWKDPSPFLLVDRSVKQLYNVARAMDWKKVVMTRPGCGHGGLHWEKQVKPLLELVLDDRFTVVHN